MKKIKSIVFTKELYEDPTDAKVFFIDGTVGIYNTVTKLRELYKEIEIQLKNFTKDDNIVYTFKTK